MEYARMVQRLLVILMLSAGLYTLSVYCEPMRPLLLADGDDPIGLFPDFQEDNFLTFQKSLKQSQEKPTTMRYHTDMDVQIATTPRDNGSRISQVDVHTSSQLATDGVITHEHETQQAYELMQSQPTEVLQQDTESILSGSPLLTRGTSMMYAARKTKLIAQNKKKLQQQLAFLPEYLQEAVHTTAYGVDGVPYQEQVRQCRALLAENNQLTRQYQSQKDLTNADYADSEYKRKYQVVLLQIERVVRQVEALIAQKNTQLKGYRHLLEVLCAKKEQASKNKKPYYSFSEITALADAVRAVQKEMVEQNTYKVRDEAFYIKCAEFEFDARRFISQRTRDIAEVADRELTRQELAFVEQSDVRFAFLHELLQPDQPYFKERQAFIDQAFEYQTGRESFDKEGKKFFAFIKSLEATAVKLSEMRLEAFPAFLQKKVTACITAYKNKELSKTATYAQIKALLAAAGTRDEWVEVIKKDVKENAPVVYKHCFPEPGWFGSLGRRKTYTRSGSGDSESSV